MNFFPWTLDAKKRCNLSIASQSSDDEIEKFFLKKCIFKNAEVECEKYKIKNKKRHEQGGSVKCIENTAKVKNV